MFGCRALSVAFVFDYWVFSRLSLGVAFGCWSLSRLALGVVFGCWALSLFGPQCCVRLLGSLYSGPQSCVWFVVLAGSPRDLVFRQLLIFLLRSGHWCLAVCRFRSFIRPHTGLCRIIE